MPALIDSWPWPKVEYQKFWLEAGDGGMERLLMLEVIEPKGGHGDDMDVEAMEVSPGSGRNALETLPDDVRGILGGKQQDSATLSGREAA